eukprot:15016555-Ditylum_brightwellii.AAC.1
MTYHIRMEEKKLQDLIQSIIYTRRNHVETDREHVNNDSTLQSELKAIDLDFFNQYDKVIVDLDETASLSFAISGEDEDEALPDLDDNEAMPEVVEHCNEDDGNKQQKSDNDEDDCNNEEDTGKEKMPALVQCKDDKDDNESDSDD